MRQAPPLPSELQIEVTAACNLRCHMCLVRYRPPIDRISGTMSLADFRRLVDDLPDLRKVTLQGLGEPLLVPHLVEMVRHAAARGIAVGFNTNGTLLTSARSEELIEAGLSWLHISVDGATAATYEAIRDGARFERVRRGVAAIVGAKQRLGSAHPDLRLVCVAMRQNHREIPELVRLAAEWGVGRLWIQNLSHSFSDTDELPGYGEIRDYARAEALWAEDAAGAEASFEAARRLAAELGVDLRLPRLEEPEPSSRPPGTPGCTWPWDSAYVTHDGSVEPCCMVMGSNRATLGDLGQAPFPEVWAGDAYQRFRAALLTDEPPAVCRGCSLYRHVF